MNLEDLLFVVNDDTMVTLLDNETGDILVDPTPNSDLLSGTEYDCCLVMDVSAYNVGDYNDILTVCIEV